MAHPIQAGSSESEINRQMGGILVHDSVVSLWTIGIFKTGRILRKDLHQPMAIIAGRKSFHRLVKNLH